MGRGGKRKLMIGNNLGIQSAFIGQISRAGQGSQRDWKAQKTERSEEKMGQDVHEGQRK